MGKFELNGRTVVITGASGGIGGAAAVCFAKRGAKLVLSGRNTEALEKIASRVKSTGAEAHIVTADVTARADMEALAKKAFDLTGGLHVMWLGAGLGVLGDVANISVETWQKEMNVNFWGVLYGFYAALPHFIKQKEGQFVILNSLSGRIPMPLNAPYCASKAALWAFADSSRAELKKKNIDMISAYPNFTKTEFQGNIESPDHNVPADLAWKMRGQTAEHVAKRIVRACEKRKGEVVFTLMGHAGIRLTTLSYHMAEFVRKTMLPMTSRMLGGGKSAER